LAVAAFCWTAPAKAAPSTPDYSKEAFVIQQFSKHITFSAVGTWQIEQTVAVLLQSDAGIQQLGVLSFSYNQDNQKIEVDYVRVRKPDGQIIATPDDNIQDISSEITRSAPTYSDLREKQIPVKALGVGDVLEYKIRFIQTKPEIAGQFWCAHAFITDTVVLSETLEIDVPEGKYVKLISPGVKPEVREKSGRKIYLWKTAHLEAASQEAGKPKKKNLPDAPANSVQLTTFKSWEEVGTWYRGLETERAAVTPAILAKADELTKGLKDEAEKERAIYNFVSTKFRYISISFGVGRYQPHSGEEVLANQYGDCKDKHTLLAALLKAAGIEAWPALIGTGAKLDDDLPSPAQFNHVITVVPGKNGYLWLDTTPEVAPFGLLARALRDRKALVIPTAGAPSLIATPANPPFPSSQNFAVEASLTPDGTLTGHFDVTMRGDFELLMRSVFHQFPPAKWREVVEGVVQGEGFAGTVSNVVVDNPSGLEKPFHYSYDYSRPNYSDWENRRISPPLLPLLSAPADDAETPSEPFFLGASGEMLYRATIRLPEKYSVDIPSTVSAKSDFAEYSGSYSLSKGVFNVERRLVIKKARIPVNAWADYRKFAKTVADDHDHFVQLQVATASGAEPAPENAEAGSLVTQAFQAGQRRDNKAVGDYLARAERINPKQRNLWAAYGSLYVSRHEPQKAIEALEKEVRFHPDNVYAYRLLAYAQGLGPARNPDQQIVTLRSLLKQAPGDVEATSSLAGLLAAAKRYVEIPDLIQPIVTKADNEFLQGLLAQALLRTGRKEEGITAVQKYVQSGDAVVLNNAAFDLADNRMDLALARQYAERAVTKIEADLSNLALSSLSDTDLQRVNSLASSWDTLGWVHFQAGDTEKAEKYVDASWRLCQRGEVADHLGQIYARQGKRPAAIHTWQLALGANNSLDDTRERLRQAGASATPERPTLKRGAGHAEFIPPNEELQKLRLTDIPALPKQQASAEFFILFSAGKPEDIQFISGSESLKGAAPALSAAHYNVAVPDDGAEKIPRRGVLSCSTYTSPSCQFVLFLPATTKK
jgi:tetratricopeptide (TPR) repeat protein